MKKFICWESTLLILCLTVLLCSGHKLFFGPRIYLDETKVEVTVTEKIGPFETLEGGKYKHISQNFILIVKVPDGRFTELSVRPSTFVNSEIGKKYNYYLNEHDIAKGPVRSKEEINNLILFIISLFATLFASWLLFRKMDKLKNQLSDR